MKIVGIMAAVICIGLILVTIISFIENRTLHVTRYKITSPKLPKELHGKKIVVLADLHNACFGKENEKLLARIYEETPEAVLAAGDMIIGEPEGDITVPVHLLQKLSEKYPIYYAKGNHELKAYAEPEVYGDLWERYKSAIQNYVHFLDNEMVELSLNGEQEPLKPPVRIIGLDIDHKYYERFRREPMEQEYLKEVLGTCDTSVYNILIAHHPAYFPAYSEWGADLVLSGHLHGGMVRLPLLGGMVSPMVQFFPKYDRGRFEEENSTMLLSGGLGSHTFKIRVNNLPELVVIEF